MSLKAAFVTHSSVRGNQVNASQLNAADCLNDDRLGFPLTLSGSTGYSLEAWAGAQCEDVTIRTSASQRQCWRLDARIASDGELALYLPVRDVLYGRTLAAAPAPGPLGEPGNFDAALACQSAYGIVPPQTLSVYFLLVDAAANVVGRLALWNAVFKLTPPPAPDRLRAASSSEQLTLEFAYASAPADTTLSAFELYCDPAPGGSHEAGPEAADPGSCRPSALLVAGMDSRLVSQQRCGFASKSASSVVIGPLTAGVPYTVAMSAVDSFGNESVLSPVVCGVPVARSAQSAACAFSRRRQTLPLLVWLSLGGFLAARRRGCRMAVIVANS